MVQRLIRRGAAPASPASLRRHLSRNAHRSCLPGKPIVSEQHLEVLLRHRRDHHVAAPARAVPARRPGAAGRAGTGPPASREISTPSNRVHRRDVDVLDRWPLFRASQQRVSWIAPNAYDAPITSAMKMPVVRAGTESCRRAGTSARKRPRSPRRRMDHPARTPAPEPSARPGPEAGDRRADQARVVVATAARVVEAEPSSRRGGSSTTTSACATSSVASRFRHSVCRSGTMLFFAAVHRRSRC